MQADAIALMDLADDPEVLDVSEDVAYPPALLTSVPLVGAVGGATGYRIDVAINSTFRTYVRGFKNLNVGNVASRSVTGLKAGTTCYVRVRAYNATGTSAHSAVQINVTPR